MAQRKPKFVTICEDSVSTYIFSLNLGNGFEHWNVLCEDINTFLKSITKEYIWHRDELKLQVNHSENIEKIPMYLRSTTCFGDNIEDEWFIVYLIIEISKKFKDVIIQLSDNDGEFLLIEAAHQLPLWVKPEHTENRVFIYNEHIHLIPPSLVKCETKLALIDALRYIVNFPDATKVSTDIENAILSRVGHFPQRIHENFHHAVINLPLNIAAVLILRPSFIAAIIHAYCNHDILDTKYNQDLNEDKVNVSVKFTKCLYAMLMHSQLRRNIIKSSSNEKRDVLGMKLTCGFNVLMNTSKKDVYQKKEFQRFLDNLKNIGYFRQNLEYSKQYNVLLEKAKIHFLEFECSQNTFVSKQIEETIHSEEYLKIKDKLKQNNLLESLKDDNDDWLNIDPEQLNNYLHAQYEENIKFNKSDFISAQVITSKLSDFLNRSSDFEGVGTRNLNMETIEFDSNEFVNCLENIMNSLSSGNVEENLSNSELEEDCDNTSDEMEEELSHKLQLYQSNKKCTESIASNLKQSIKEEGLSGPSSNLLTSVGINKTDFMDSDDEN